MRFTLITLVMVMVTPCWGLDEYWMPVVDGDFWSVAGNPDLGKYTSKRQQPVDFGVWQAADGTWQLWSCIRQTKCGGNTRLFYRWEGKNLTDPDWKPMGIAMEAKPELGETLGGMQAPHVVKYNGLYWMAYGDWVNICFATSKDGKNFERVIQPNGKTGVFSEGPKVNTRDAMLLHSKGLWYCYYTGSDTYRRNGYVFARTSPDLKNWSHSCVVNYGGIPGNSPWGHECPHVVEIEPGSYVLFRNQRYGPKAVFTVYNSPNPLNFGIDNDEFRIGTMPYAAPEVIYHNGQYYLATLKPHLNGLQIAKLKWIKYSTKGKNIFDFNDAQTRRSFKLIEGNLVNIFTDTHRRHFLPPMKYFIGTAEIDGIKHKDKTTGVIESPEFTLDADRYHLYVSGGQAPEKLYVALIESQTGKEITRYSGKTNHTLEAIPFEAGPHKGKKVIIRIVDQHQGPWGHINFGGIYAHTRIAEK